MWQDRIEMCEATIQGQYLYVSAYNYIEEYSYEYYGEKHVRFSIPKGSQISIREEGSCGNFLGWSDRVNDTYRDIIITSDTTISSLFDVKNYIVKISAEKGGWISNGNRIEVRSECDRWFSDCVSPWDGYYFVGWSNGIKESCIDLYLEEDTTILVAQFAEIQQVKVKVGASNKCTSMGTVEGGGTYMAGDYAMISTTPNEGYHFVEWNDGNMSAQREVYLTSDTTLYAVFGVGSFGGKCGNNLRWTYDTLTNALSITGSEDMHFDEHGEPWWTFRDQIKTVNLPNELTSVESSAFSGCTALTAITIPEGVKYIGGEAFVECSSLTYISIPSTAEFEYGYSVLWECSNL